MLSDFKLASPIGSDADRRPDPAPSPSCSGTLRLFVAGFSETERRMLEATVKLSQRRVPSISLMGHATCMEADVVMIDAEDPNVVRWVCTQPWLRHKAVIWVNMEQVPCLAGLVPQGHTLIHRPVRWTLLPMLLARAFDDKSASPSVADRPPAPGAALRKSVLVIDDSLAMRQHLRSLLEARNVAVGDVDNAESGLALLASRDRNIACVLLDVLMPGVDGYDACRRIKAMPRTGPAPKVVMLTSKSSPFDRIRGKMAGCDAYLTKPVEPDKLYQTLSKYLA